MNIYFFPSWRVRRPRITCWQTCVVPDKGPFHGLRAVICLVTISHRKAQVVETRSFDSLFPNASFLWWILLPSLCPSPQAVKLLVSVLRKVLWGSLEWWHHWSAYCLCQQVSTGIFFIMKPIFLNIWCKNLLKEFIPPIY